MMRTQYFKYKEKFIKKDNDYEVEVIGGDIEVKKVPNNLLSFEELEETITEQELVVWAYIRYTPIDDYTSLGYEICE